MGTFLIDGSQILLDSELTSRMRGASCKLPQNSKMLSLSPQASKMQKIDRSSNKNGKVIAKIQNRSRLSDDVSTESIQGLLQQDETLLVPWKFSMRSRGSSCTFKAGIFRRSDIEEQNGKRRPVVRGGN